MAGWSTSAKRLEIVKQTPHPCATPSVGGAPLTVTVFDFTPVEFYLAAAFCSHMHPVSPSAASPEAKMIRALVAHHVDDAKPDFAIEATADGFKDYVKSYFSGTVATALAFIGMQRNGYRWSGHFEHLRPPSAKGRSPDFVFASPVFGTCLVESKGTRSANSGAFDGVVEDGYLMQVERHLGTSLVGGAFPSHGYCIGSWMTSVSRAELVVHHSFATPAGSGAASKVGAGGRIGDGDGRGIKAVQRQDMGTVFTLVFGARWGEAVRAGRIDELPVLIQIEWMERSWIAAANWPADFVLELPLKSFRTSFPVGRRVFRDYAFMIERSVLATALRRYGAEGDDMAADTDFPTFDADDVAMARRSGGALLGDGLAAVPAFTRVRASRVEWNRRTGEFESA